MQSFPNKLILTYLAKYDIAKSNSRILTDRFPGIDWQGHGFNWEDRHWAAMPFTGYLREYSPDEFKTLVPDLGALKKFIQGRENEQNPDGDIDAIVNFLDNFLLPSMITVAHKLGLTKGLDPSSQRMELFYRLQEALFNARETDEITPVANSEAMDLGQDRLNQLLDVVGDSSINRAKQPALKEDLARLSPTWVKGFQRLLGEDLRGFTKAWVDTHGTKSLRLLAEMLGDEKALQQPSFNVEDYARWNMTKNLAIGLNQTLQAFLNSHAPISPESAKTLLRDVYLNAPSAILNAGPGDFSQIRANGATPSPTKISEKDRDPKGEITLRRLELLSTKVPWSVLTNDELQIIQRLMDANGYIVLAIDNTPNKKHTLLNMDLYGGTFTVNKGDELSASGSCIEFLSEVLVIADKLQLADDTPLSWHRLRQILFKTTDPQPLPKNWLEKFPKQYRETIASWQQAGYPLESDGRGEAYKRWIATTPDPKEAKDHLIFLGEFFSKGSPEFSYAELTWNFRVNPHALRDFLRQHDTNKKIRSTSTVDSSGVLTLDALQKQYPDLNWSKLSELELSYVKAYIDSRDYLALVRGLAPENRTLFSQSLLNAFIKLGIEGGGDANLLVVNATTKFFGKKGLQSLPNDWLDRIPPKQAEAFRSWQEAGYPVTEDMNGKAQAWFNSLGGAGPELLKSLLNLAHDLGFVESKPSGAPSLVKFREILGVAPPQSAKTTSPSPEPGEAGSPSVAKDKESPHTDAIPKASTETTPTPPKKEPPPAVNEQAPLDIAQAEPAPTLDVNPAPAAVEKIEPAPPTSPTDSATPLDDTTSSEVSIPLDEASLDSQPLAPSAIPPKDIETTSNATVQTLETLLSRSGAERPIIKKAIENGLVVAQLLASDDANNLPPGLHSPVELTPAEAIILGAYHAAGYDPQTRTFSKPITDRTSRELSDFLVERQLVELGSKDRREEIFRNTSRSAINKIYTSLYPDNNFPNTKIHKVMEHLGEQFSQSSRSKVGSAKEHAEAVFQSLVEDDILSPDMAASFMSSVFGPEPNQRNNGARSTRLSWNLPKTDIRHFLVTVPNAEDRRRFQEERGQAFLEVLQRFGDTGLEAGETSEAEFAYRKSIGLRALRDSYPASVAELFAEARRNNIVPGVAELQQRFFPKVDPSKSSTVGNAAMSDFLKEVELAATFATQLHEKESWKNQPLTPAQATAGLRLDEKISKALSSGERQSYLISLAQANDNRRAAFAALASNATVAQNPPAVVIWTSSPYLTGNVVPDEARAALGDAYDIVESTADLAQRMSDPRRTKPLLAILSDDALTADANGLGRLQQDLKNRPGLPLIYVADEAQRLTDPNSNRRTALSPLVERAQMTIGLSAEPVSTKVSNLYNLGTFLGVPNLNEAHRENAVLMYAAMSPYFMAASSQRPQPDTQYPNVPYSEEGWELSKDIESDEAIGTGKFHMQNSFGTLEKLPFIVERVAQRVEQHGKVVIGTSYVKDGVNPLKNKLKELSETQGVRVGSIDGSTPLKDRREMLHRFALPANETDAIDVLITTFSAVSGDSAVDLTRPPRGGYEVIAADIPKTPRDLKGLIGLVEREEWSSDIKVRVTIPVMSPPKNVSTNGSGMTQDQNKLTTLLKRGEAADGTLGANQEIEVYDPTPMQLARYRLGTSYGRSLKENEAFFANIKAVKAYMEANEAPGAWQQSQTFLQRRVRASAKNFQEKNTRLPTMVDFGSGYNYLVTKMLQGGLIAEGVGIDLIPKKTMTALVQDRTLAKGSDTHHVKGNIEDAPRLLEEHYDAGFRADIVTASFSLLADTPDLMARYFRAASDVLNPGGRFMVIHPLSSFNPARQDKLEEGWKQMGFEKVEDTELVTVGGAVRYFELRKVRPAQRVVDPELFRFK